MKFEDALEKSERMHALIIGPAPGNEPHNMEDLIVADAKLKNHCRKQLPRLLRAVEAGRKTRIEYQMAIDADDPVARHKGILAFGAAASELHAAIEAAREVPDA